MLCLKAAVGMTGNFLQIYIKNSLLQTKSIEIWVNTQYHIMHVSILDHYRFIFDTLILTFQGHSRSNVIVSLDSPYMVSY